MSRRSQAPTRTILPDPKFNSVLLAKFMNMVMERGKKSIASSIVYDALTQVEERTKRPPIEVCRLSISARSNGRALCTTPSAVRRAVTLPPSPSTSASGTQAGAACRAVSGRSSVGPTGAA